MKPGLKILLGLTAVFGTIGALCGVALHENDMPAYNLVRADDNHISCYDELTANLFAATSTSYKDFTNVGRYAGNSAKTSDGAIQLRSKNSNSGIVTTSSPGLLRHIELVWNNSTTKGNKLDVYGSHTAYTNASNLYNNNVHTKLGSIVCGTNTELDISEDFEYIRASLL